MNKLLLNEDTELTINSDEAAEQSFDVQTAERSSVTLTVMLEGKKPLNLDWKLQTARNSRLTILTVNHLDEKLTLNEEYDLQSDSEALVAHCQLNNAQTELNGKYNLLAEGASLKVQTAIMSSSVKKFNQDTFHLAGHTSAEIVNLGVVGPDSSCDLVVRNTINQGSHGASTHQTSRLLTYDKTAVGRILPVLYIYDNDVQASHAATMGQPDESQIYYLMTRGLSRKEAMNLIMTGYLLPITKIVDNQQLDELLKNEIETKVLEECSM